MFMPGAMGSVDKSEMPQHSQCSSTNCCAPDDDAGVPSWDGVPGAPLVAPPEMRNLRLLLFAYHVVNLT